MDDDSKTWCWFCRITTNPRKGDNPLDPRCPRCGHQLEAQPAHTDTHQAASAAVKRAQGRTP